MLREGELGGGGVRGIGGSEIGGGQRVVDRGIGGVGGKVDKGGVDWGELSIEGADREC